jgi:signal transduction histidine kinase
MKLRNQLFASTSVPLVVLGALFALGYVGYRRAVVPDLHGYIEHRASSGATVLQSQLDVPLGAGDPAMVAEAVRETLRDPDLAYLEVQDASGVAVFRHGHPGAGSVRASAAISLEGMALGRVEVRYSTRRIDLIDTWAKRFFGLVLLLWLAAVAHALRFSRAFVAPLRLMMDYSRTVAGGKFDAHLDTRAGGELRDLADDLNRMAAELDARAQERERTAARVSAMQQELLTVTRMAGMAEVATGVLHNVGNVLNSLNTSVIVVQSRLKASKVAALSRGVELYREFPGGLGAFLATDKGKVLPQYLDKVSVQLAAENAEALGELESINRNVHHIATIVATQQAYTRVSAVHEPTDVTTLCNDALQMVEGSFQRHAITVVRDYRPVSALVTDRHKVLQIIVNLVSNARHALNESVRDEKRLRVAISSASEGELRVEVEDNGVGIAAANLDRIFQHGFTTRKDGHGFGLHSAANAAAELGGRITVTSAGAGLGATFTLLLPLAPPALPREDSHAN